LNKLFKGILSIGLIGTLLMSDTTYVVNSPVYTNIYSADNKIPEVGVVVLTWKVVKEKSKRRNYFHKNNKLPSNIQASRKDYYKTPFDRGHFSANKADWDNNKSDMYYSFSFTNMTPQYPKTNRRSYRKVENYARKMTKKYNNVVVISIAVPGDKFMKGHINIPKEYYKILTYNNTKECFKIPNDNKSYKLKEMRISCDGIKY